MNIDHNDPDYNDKTDPAPGNGRHLSTDGHDNDYDDFDHDGDNDYDDSDHDGDNDYDDFDHDGDNDYDDFDH